ncbi:stress-activated map kinase-interacting protein 1 [Bombyx mandarina]|uniref:Stress-activated map kinase-interacting protein 1 n=1 Tax=Bombyx mandarina TaxID=7092 RepID=A0A6J2JZH2_BOMMA|nr:stress-activated map kinase-interacting protein 1 [Bombyx mandarina]
MATYDNKIWLLKNIRDAFIATDDTGLCEIVMAGEDFSKIFQIKGLEEKKRIKEARALQPGTSKIREGGDSCEDFEREIITQFEPYPDIDESEDEDPLGSSYVRYEEFGGYRQRSNTSQWLDKKEQALKKAAKIKVIKWEDSSPLSKEQCMELFPTVEVKPPEKQKSLLAQQLENCPDLPHRQYLEYGKFDGTAQLGLQTKCFKIFMTMLSEKHQNYPLVVCVIASAKIKDLIGFTCYKYSIEHPEISLGSVHEYGLCIAEDDGEVDWAFPCLDANEPCSKFGFTCLGLIELKNKKSFNSPPIPMPDDGHVFHLFPKMTDSGQSHNNPSRHNTGGSQTSEAVISALRAVNEEKKSSEDANLEKIQCHIMATEAPQYKSYKVQLLRKVRTNTSVQLGISLDRIEIEPLVTHKHVFWSNSRSKYFLHSIESVAWCQILETRGYRTTFRIVYSPSQKNNSVSDKNASEHAGYSHLHTTYKYHDFESDHETAKEIVEKVNTILDLLNSSCRREYKISKEKKSQTRRSFHTKHLS